MDTRKPTKAPCDGVTQAQLLRAADNLTGRIRRLRSVRNMIARDGSIDSGIVESARIGTRYDGAANDQLHLAGSLHTRNSAEKAPCRESSMMPVKQACCLQAPVAKGANPHFRE